MEIKLLNRMSKGKSTITVTLDSDEVTDLTNILYDAVKRKNMDHHAVELFGELSALQYLVCNGRTVLPETTMEEMRNGKP